MWCEFIKLSVMLKKIFFSIILLGYKEIALATKIQLTTKLVLTFTPIAFVLDSFNLWFEKNTMFFSFIIYTLLINIIVGAWYHFKAKTFDWKMFIEKNLQMSVVIILTYPILEFLRLIAGENIAGEVFKVTIQIATILYPASKILKNIYILSNKQYPPKFIMERIYDFEKNGNFIELFKKEKIKENETIE